ncbi:MAG: tripartite tricarboxylate transporter substrate binding protein [Burkholderiales bacterium]|nr:tripartite tricarboxylate transporter substrate binding protein [Burkholderiales bacterium]
MDQPDPARPSVVPDRTCRALAGLLLATAAAAAIAAAAEHYPSRPVTIVVSFPPGAATDISARVAANAMSETLGQKVMVYNRDGASGVIGTDHVAKSAPDGYTTLWGSSALTISASIAAKLPYDPRRDFLPVGLFTRIPFLLVVHPSVPVKTVKELVTLAKANPGKLNYGSSGHNAFNHLGVELLKLKTGVKLMHIPYRGAAPMSADLLAGQVDLAITGPTTAAPHMDRGRLRAIAVTSRERSATFAALPTMMEAGVPDYEFTQWYGLMAPAKTPREAIDRLNAALRKAVADPLAQKRMAGEAGVLVSTTPEEFTAFVHADIDDKAKLVKAIGAQP